MPKLNEEDQKALLDYILHFGEEPIFTAISFFDARTYSERLRDAIKADVPIREEEPPEGADI